MRRQNLPGSLLIRVLTNVVSVMNTIALLRENPDPSDDEIRAYLAGNLCRCSGYEGQLRGIRNYLDSRIPADDRQ